MYEEEDDDLPMQYRRLTAHLQTSNADFDRRLAAYLTNHVAMRTALGQAVSAQSQGYINAAQFANQGSSAGHQQAAFAPQNPMGPPSNWSPNAFRQTPYSSPYHNRSNSISATPSGAVVPKSPSQSMDSAAAAEAQRRSSLPAHHMAANQNGQIWNRRNKSIHNLKLENLPSPQAHGMSSTLNSNDSNMVSPQSYHQRQVKPSELPAAFDTSSFNPMSGAFGGMPFSTSLPLESQQLLGGAFDANDPMSAMLMGGQFDANQAYSEDGMPIKSEMHAYGGMDQTLAPSALDTTVGGYNADSGPDSAFTQASPFATSAGGFGYGADSAYEAFKGTSLAGSGEATPSGEWHSFIDGNVWEQQSSQPT